MTNMEKLLYELYPTSIKSTTSYVIYLDGGFPPIVIPHDGLAAFLEEELMELEE